MLIGGMVAVAAAAWFWRGGGDDDEKARSATSATNPASANERAGLRAPTDPRAARVDPRSKERGRITGTVRDDAGAGVAEARVCATFQSDELGGEESHEPACGDASADGRYTLSDLVEGTYRLYAGAPGFIPALYKGADKRRWFRLASGEERDGVDLILERGGVEVRGVVKDIGGGPVGDALVTASSGRRWRSQVMGFTRSDDKGEFTLWAAPGAIQVQATADGYSQGESEGVAPGQHIEVLLTPEAALSGVVVEAGTRNPVVGAQVEVGSDDFNWRGGDGTGSGSATTDEQGRFRITRLAPGRYKPEATAVGAYGKAAESVLLGLGQVRDDVVIEVHPAFVVTGKIVIKDGEQERSCDNGRVWLHDKSRDRDFRGQAREDGSVRIQAVMPGTYKANVRCRDYLEQDTYPEVVVSDADVVDLVWTVSPGAAIVGRIVDQARQPVTEATIRAQMSGADPRAQRSWGWGQSEKDGTFELKGLVAGTYSVQADSAKHPEPEEPTKVELAAGEQKEIELVLDAGGTIEGAVVDENGKPVSGADIRAVGKTWGFWRNQAMSKDDGSFEVEGVPPGEVRVEASRGWRDTLRAPGKTDDDTQGEKVQVVAGQTVTVNLVVESQSGQITGKVLDADGEPVGDAYVSAQRESDAAGAQRGNARRASRWSWGKQPELTNPDGEFTLDELSPGTYTVRAYRRGGGEAFAEGVAVGSDTTLAIRRTSSISGKVSLDEDGGVPDEFSVAVSDRKVGFSRNEKFFRTDGTWTLRDLPAGNYTVSVSAAEGTAEIETDVADGEERAGLLFTLESRTTIKGRLVGLEDGKPVAGMMIAAQPVKGSDGSFRVMLGQDDEKKNISDSDGSFEVAKAPSGKLFITAFPLDWQESPYSFMRVTRTVPGGGVHDVGEIKIPRRRVKDARGRGGDLGFQLVEQPPGTDPEKVQFEIALVRPDGPAAESGLKKGDKIIAVDGHDVTGDSMLYWTLTRVSEGTKLDFGLERGETASVTAGPPR